MPCGRTIGLLLALSAVGVLASSAAAAEAVSLAVDPSDSLSITDCMRIARSAAPDARVAALTWKAAMWDSTSAARNGRPKIDLIGSVHVAPSWSYDPAVTNLGEYAVQIGVSVPLFDGGERSRARQLAAIDTRTAARELDLAARSAAEQAGVLAVEVLRLRERAGFETAALLRLDELLRLLTSRVQAGATGASDVDRVSIERDGLRASLESTRTELRIVSRELAGILGWPPGTTPLVRVPRPEEERIPTTADSTEIVAGVGGLPEVLLAAYSQALAEVDRDESAHASSPRIDAMADAGLAGTDLTRAVPPDVRAEDPGANIGDRLRRDLGASASITFTRSLIDAESGPTLEARKASARAASLAYDATTEAQRRAALDLVERWRSTTGRLLAQEDIVARAERSLLRIRSLYVAGAAGILDLLDAQRTLDDAHGEVADARAESRSLGVEADARF